MLYKYRSAESKKEEFVYITVFAAFLSSLISNILLYGIPNAAANFFVALIIRDVVKTLY